MPRATPYASTTTTTTTTDAEPRPLTFYPAYCHPSSPTWDTWVKLTAHDVHHALRPHPRRQDLISSIPGAHFHHDPATFPTLYYLNHPIQFVQLVGVVVSYEIYHARFWLFSLDDSSGETIEVICPKPPDLQPQPGEATEAEQDGVLNPFAPVDDEEEEKEKQTTHITEEPDPDPEETQQQVILRAVMGTLDIGTVVQAKGTISHFRNTPQLSLKRLKVLRSTAEELRLIDGRSRFLESVLSRPWVVAAPEQRRLLMRASGEDEALERLAAHRRDKERRRQEREKRHADRIARQYAREEKEREAMANKARGAGISLMKRFGK